MKTRCYFGLAFFGTIANLSSISAANVDDSVKQILIENSYKSWISAEMYDHYYDGRPRWYRDAEYKDSIFIVISKALVDCILLRNEFAIDSAKHHKNGIITFENNNVNSYQQEHWNALLLYNYFSHIINDRFNVGYTGELRHIKKYSNLKSEGEAYYSKSELTRNAVNSAIKGLNFVADQLREHYKNVIPPELLNKFLDKAVYDLDSYFVGDSRGLDVYDYLKHIKQKTHESDYFLCSETFASDKTVFIPRVSLEKQSSNDNSARYLCTIKGRNATFKSGNDTMYGSTSFTITDDKITEYRIRCKRDKRERTKRRAWVNYKIKVNPYFEIIEME